MRQAPPPPSKNLDHISDEALIAELQKRGLADRRGIVMALLGQRDKAIKERNEAIEKLAKAR